MLWFLYFHRLPSTRGSFPPPPLAPAPAGRGEKGAVRYVEFFDSFAVVDAEDEPTTPGGRAPDRRASVGSEHSTLSPTSPPALGRAGLCGNPRKPVAMAMGGGWWEAPTPHQALLYFRRC